MSQLIKILLVDDEADFRQVMTFWLESKGYQVQTACDGQAALELVKKEHPHIIFLDLNMPVMDGYQALKKIREIDALIPVILISAYVDDSRINDLMVRYKVSGIFYKGRDFQEGLTLLETALRTHKDLKNAGDKP